MPTLHADRHAPPLSTAGVHIWFTRYDAADPSTERLYRSLLDVAEVRREQSLRHAADRRSYGMTRALARTVLSRYTMMAPRTHSFVTDGHGRPILANGSPGLRAVFNISHTRGMSVFAITGDRHLGVDAEAPEHRSFVLDMAARYFAPQEAAYLQALPADDRYAAFYEFWTLKEAYIKARGRGLALPLDQFTFTLSPQLRLDCAFVQSADRDHDTWHFWQFRPTAAHLVAVCAGRLATPRPALLVMEIIDMRRTVAHDTELLRSA